MSEVTATFSWIIAMLKLGIFSILFAFSIVLVRVSKLKELAFFSLTALCFMLSSLFELFIAISYLDHTITFMNPAFASFASQVLLFFGAIFFFLFLFYVNRNMKNYL